MFDLFKKILKKLFEKRSFFLSLRSQPIRKRDDFVAQLVEQYTFNVWVLGSSPNEITEVSRPKQ